MNLNDYIALSSERPNRAVLQGLGASKELIEYLMKTPENTNWNVLNGMSESDSSDGNDELTVYILFNGDYLFNDQFKTAGLDYVNPEKAEIFAYCEAHNNNNIAQNINVMVFQDLASSPQKSEQSVSKSYYDTWQWYSNGINNTGYMFSVDAGGNWVSGYSD